MIYIGMLIYQYCCVRETAVISRKAFVSDDRHADPQPCRHSSVCVKRIWREQRCLSFGRLPTVWHRQTVQTVEMSGTRHVGGRKIWRGSQDASNLRDPARLI